MKIYTIGFTQKSAQQFFSILKEHNDLERIIDIRLNNVSQLAGFTKMNDLKYFLKQICDLDYSYSPELAPTKEILDHYKKEGGDWSAYEKRFLALLNDRQTEFNVDKHLMANSCLLCSEATPEHCHRRLVAEYFKQKWGDVEIQHL